MKSPMKAWWPAALLALVCVLQWALPASLALRSELTLRSGTRYYLRTAPVDPLDPFRGRYVTLSFSGTRTTVAKSEAVNYGDTVYVPIHAGSDRYAVFGPASRQPPAGGDWLRATVARFADDGTIELRLPFDRYYLDEHAAPAAEQAYREANRRDAKHEAYVAIRVRDGHAALEELFIDNVPVRQLLKAQAAR